MFPYGRTVTVIPVTRDVHGDESFGRPRQLRGVAVAPRTSSEPSQDRRAATTISGVSLYLPVGHGITKDDRVVLDDGTQWQVDGHPVLWASPFSGWAPGCQADLTRVEG